MINHWATQNDRVHTHMRHFAQRLERSSNRSKSLGNTKRELTPMRQIRHTENATFSDRLESLGNKKRESTPMRQIRHTENGTFSDRSKSLGYTKHGTFSDRSVTELTERQDTRHVTQASTRFQIDHGLWVTQNDQVCVTSHRE